MLIIVTIAVNLSQTSEYDCVCADVRLPVFECNKNLQFARRNIWPMVVDVLQILLL